jgi:hypothetical protein
MAPRAIAAASAAVALAAFAATLVVASARPAPSRSLAALAGASARPPDRPAPQPALTDGDVPAGAADEPAGQGGESAVGGSSDDRPVHPPLTSAPHEVVLYAKGCAEWWATEPWLDGRRFPVHGVGDTCAVQWTPGGDLVSLHRGDRGDSIVVTGRSGDATRVALPGRRIEGPLALRPDLVVACTRTGRRTALYRWSIGAVAPERYRDGCQPAFARDGSLAYAHGAAGRRGIGLARVVVERAGQKPRTVAAWPGADVRALAWTGDGRRLVATITVDGRTEIISVDLDGDDDHLLASLAGGTIQAHPSPAGSRVVMTIVPEAGTSSVEARDATLGTAQWSAPTDGLVDVTWSPSGSRLLIADRHWWSFVEPATGVQRLQLDRLGDAPSWCCPGATVG